jgi:glycosyltransferase involved in cell wall biosynthesis
MFLPKVPRWVRKHNLNYRSFEEVPEEIFERIRKGLADKRPKNPEVSIIAITYNEGAKVLRMLSSMADLQSKHSVEVIVVNNNSTDDTQKYLERCGVMNVFERRQGIPWARQAGMDVARGKYHLTADGDAIYPPQYADTLVRHLENPGVVCVFGLGSFLPDASKSRLQLAFYEFFKDLVIRLRSIKRPEQSVRSQSMGFLAEPAKEIGWNTGVKRGSDGRLAWGLMNYGKVKLVRSKGARIWTTTETLNRDGSFGQMIATRVKREFKRIGEYFVKQKGEYEEIEDIDKNLEEMQTKLDQKKQENKKAGD